MVVRPKLRYATPQATGPVIDGLVLREVHLSLPPDAPHGISVTFLNTVNGEPVGQPETAVFAADEMPDPLACFTELTRFIGQALETRLRIPRGTSAVVVREEAKREPAKEPEPGIRLG